MSGRFADLRATRTVDLGPCECPGTPHPSDYVVIRADLSSSEVTILLRLDRRDEREQGEVIAGFLVEWNLLDEDGPVAITGDAVYNLRGPTAKAIGLGVSESIKASVSPPNAFAAPSRASRRGSGSPTPISTRRRGT